MKFDDFNILSIGSTIQLAGAIWSGEGKTILCFLPEHNEGFPVEELNMTTEEWEKFIRQTDLVETEVLANLGDNKVGKMLLRKNQRQISQDVSWKVFRRDKFKCRYCGADNCPLTVDHLVLWEDGGPTIINNLFSACKKCNKTRGNMKYEDWLNSKQYKKLSRRLSEEEQKANWVVVTKLKDIPIMLHKPKHR